MTEDWHSDLPEGVEIIGRDGAALKIRIPLPTDDQGLIVVNCPADGSHRFGVELRFEGVEADLVYCPYCGHRDGLDVFLTDDTRRVVTEYSLAIAGREAMDQLAAEGWNVTPNPLPQTYYSYEQEPTRRTMTCGRCGETTAVFGVAMFCPGCGRLAPADAFTEQLDIKRRMLDDLAAVPNEFSAQMEANGGITTIYENSVKDVATAIETLLKATFTHQAKDAEKLLKAEKRSGNVFQRLHTDVEPLFRDHLSIDLPGSLGDAWTTLLEGMATRHVLTHLNGFVDQKYLDQVPHSTLAIEQRLTISKAFVERQLDAATDLGNLLAPALAGP